MKKLLLIAILVCLKQVNAQIITTVAGGGSLQPGALNDYGDGGPAIGAGMLNPVALAFDAVGNLYIVDQNQIRKVNTAGIISTFAGTGTAYGYGGDGGPATAAELYWPDGIAIDSYGNIYISDSYNYRVRKINTAGIISTLAGNGTYSYSGDGGPATLAALYAPAGLAVDNSGNIYIADYYNNRIRKVSTSGIISTFAGNGTAGYSGDGEQATAAKLNSPDGITVDAMGNLYIADSSVIRKVNTAGIISTFAGNGILGYSGDGGNATNANFNQPHGVTIDAAGNLYISDFGNEVVRKVNTMGIVSTIAGNGYGAGGGYGGYAGDGGAATAAELWYPQNTALDAIGDLYIADEYNNRVRKVTNIATEGIEQFTNNNEQVNIYPNPNNGSFVIEPNSAIKQTMQMYDVNGKMLLSQTINGKTSIDASNLNEGVYNISLQSNEGVVNKRLVIVR